MNTIKINIDGYSKELKKMIICKLSYFSNEIVEIKDLKEYLLVNINSINPENLENEIINFVKDIGDNFKDVDENIYFSHDTNLSFYEENIYDKLLKNKCLVTFGQGLIGFTDEFLKVFNQVDEFICYLAKLVDAKDYIYPDLIDVDTLNKCNYLSQFPHQLVFASNIEKKAKTINCFCNDIEKNCMCIKNKLDEPKLINKPTICYHVYKQFENTIIEEPPKIITSKGRCKRYESLNTKTLERLLDFTMREIVFIGKKEQVLEKREFLMQQVQSAISKMDIYSNIKTSYDPFFTSKYTPKALIQKKFKLKYELNAYLPDSQDELSIGSFNYHGTFFGEKFNIKLRDGSFAHTACIGFGLERFTYAYLNQKGNNCKKLETFLEEIKLG